MIADGEAQSQARANAAHKPSLPAATVVACGNHDRNTFEDQLRLAPDREHAFAKESLSTEREILLPYPPASHVLYIEFVEEVSVGIVRNSRELLGDESLEADLSVERDGSRRMPAEVVVEPHERG